MNGRWVFALSMTVLWSIVFANAMNDVTIGICLGICTGMAFGLLGDERDAENIGKGMKQRIWRRIVVKEAVFAVWAIGMLVLVLQGDLELPQRTYLYMLFVMLAIWVVSTVRDVHRLRRLRK